MCSNRRPIPISCKNLHTHKLKLPVIHCHGFPSLRSLTIRPSFYNIALILTLPFSPLLTATHPCALVTSSSHVSILNPLQPYTCSFPLVPETISSQLFSHLNTFAPNANSEHYCSASLPRQHSLSSSHLQQQFHIQHGTVKPMAADSTDKSTVASFLGLGE